jgi:hypothetical protein
MWAQHPFEFEFTPELLLFIGYHCYSAAFGNIVFRNDKERIEKGCVTKTVSIWSFVLGNQSRFSNPLYLPKKKSLHIHYREKELRVWREYFGTLEEVLKKELPPGKQEGLLEDVLLSEVLRLKAENDELRSKVASQEGKIEELNKNSTLQVEQPNIESEESDEEGLLKPSRSPMPEMVASLHVPSEPQKRRPSSHDSDKHPKTHVHDPDD